MPQELLQLNTRKVAIRLLLIVLLLAAIAWSYYVVRWYAGNTMADYFDPSENNLRVAQSAVSLAPEDPLTHWRLAQAMQKSLPLDQQMQAIPQYEKAVSLSPNDYRFWMALGTASEQAGDRVKAERALRQAVTLAPAYAYPHWYLGNLLLRSGRYDEAFAELRVASEADHEFQPQQFNLIWEIYGADPEGLEKAVGESALARGKFALYLLGRQKFDEGLRLWDSLSVDEKKANKETAEALVTSLVGNARYHNALKVWNDIAPSEKFRAEVGRVFDPGFEEASNYGPEMAFGWQVEQVQQVQVGIDPVKSHSGATSLRLAFHVRSNIENINVAQLVPVTPNTEYDFEFYVSTEKLETGGPTLVQIVDPATTGPLVSSPGAPGGTSDWTRVALTFKTGDKMEAVLIRIARPSCGTEEAPICPIFGSVWYDDFSIKRRG
ncbi:MAG TPA: tetratricopeptide repeat protein [Pyrinomonadaceae bacterium]|nr:tetratricopeptide repeat protein [Pyrinomonadaceae bacterium]